MADLNYTVGLTDNASAKLKTLESNVKKVSDKFSGLQSAVAGIAFGALINNALQFADAIQDISNATGIATENILGFSSAVANNGGQADDAQKAILKLATTINDAASGSKSAQSAFADVGVTLKDLATLSEQDILKKTIDGLANIEDASKRVSLSAELLGKSFRGVDVKGLNKEYANAVIQSREYAASIKAASEAQDRLDRTINQFRLSLLQSLKPLIDFMATLKPDDIKRFTDALVQIGGATVGLVALGKALEALGIAFAVFKGYTLLAKTGLLDMTKTISALGTQWRGFSRAFASAEGMLASLGAVWTTVSLLFTTRLKWILLAFAKMTPLIASVTTAIWAVNEVVKVAFGVDYIDKFTTGVGKAYDKFKQFIGLGGETPKAAAGPIGNAGRGAMSQEQQKGLWDEANKNMQLYKQEQEVKRQATDAWAKQTQEIVKQTQAYKDQNNELIKAVGTEAKYLGMNEDVVEVLRAQAELMIRTQQAVKQLQEQKAALSEEDKKLIPIIDAQIAAIQKQAVVDKERLAVAISGLQAARILEKDRLNAIEEITKQMERQAMLGDQLRAANDKMRDVMYETSTMNLAPLQKQYADINEEARKGALEASRTFAAAFEDGGDGLSPEKAKELADGLAEIQKRYKSIADQQIKNLEISRSFEYGWKQAFNSYVDSATNAANRARDAFSVLTSNMEQLIDNFVETGKFSFSDFAESVIKDLLKIELKAATMELWKVMSGGGSSGGGGGGGGSILGTLWDWGKGLLGFANGGNPPIGRASLVGENGPELITPRGATTITPLGAGGGPTYYITNNISAIDAKGVAQLFAENRKILLGNVRMAEKEMPSRR